MRQAIINGRVITPFRVLSEGVVLVEDGKILAVHDDPRTVDLSGFEPLDAKGLYLSPGFVDIHVHGGGGYETMDADPQCIVRMCEAHGQFGTTSIVPTTLAAPLDDIAHAIDGVKAARERCTGCDILGVHLEGPYFAKSQRGAQNEAHIIPPEPAEYLPLLDRWDKILMMGVAPELPGAYALGRELDRRGIVASIAHTDATYTDVMGAIENGFRDVTHLYSGCSGVVRVNAYRIAGVIEAGLLRDELTVQVIADGKHLPEALLRLIYKCKGSERISLITDGLSFSASKLEEGVVYEQKNGVQVVLEDGVMKLLDRQSFAGSVSTSSRLVRNMIELAGVSLPDAVKMATATPARVIGADTYKGRIAPGYDADLILFDGQIDVKFVMVKGRIVKDETVSYCGDH